MSDAPAGDGIEFLNVPMKRVSPDDGGHWWFGYYEKSPWDAEGRRLLAHRIDFVGRQPEPGEHISLHVGEADDEGGYHWRQLADTAAWSWQQGTMLQWRGPGFDEQVVYNVADGDRSVGVIHTLGSGQTRQLDKPIYALDPLGRHAISLDFGRLHRLRAGYGHHGAAELSPDDTRPDDNGLWRVDLDSGEATLLVSLAQLAADSDPQPAALSPEAIKATIKRAIGKGEPVRTHWVNHPQYNTDGSRIAFLHRWHAYGWPGFTTRALTVPIAGGEPSVIADTGNFSHYDWRDTDHLMGWAKGRDDSMAFFNYHATDGEQEAVGRDVMTQDGHNTFSPDRRWLLNDTYPDKQNFRTLYLYDLQQGTRHDLAKLLAQPEDFPNPCRCDFHPRFSRDGQRVSIDSMHEGVRAMYELDVSGVVNA